MVLSELLFQDLLQNQVTRKFDYYNIIQINEVLLQIRIYAFMREGLIFCSKRAKIFRFIIHNEIPQIVKVFSTCSSDRHCNTSHHQRTIQSRSQNYRHLQNKITIRQWWFCCMLLSNKIKNWIEICLKSNIKVIINDEKIRGNIETKH